MADGFNKLVGFRNIGNLGRVILTTADSDKGISMIQHLTQGKPIEEGIVILAINGKKAVGYALVSPGEIMALKDLFVEDRLYGEGVEDFIVNSLKEIADSKNMGGIEVLCDDPRHEDILESHGFEKSGAKLDESAFWTWNNLVFKEVNDKSNEIIKQMRKSFYDDHHGGSDSDGDYSIRKGQRFFVIKSGIKQAGYVLTKRVLRKENKQTKKFVHAVELYVSPDMRNRGAGIGIGSTAVKKLADYADKDCLHGVEVEVELMNPKYKQLMNFYKRNGFKEGPTCSLRGEPVTQIMRKYVV